MVNAVHIVNNNIPSLMNNPTKLAPSPINIQSLNHWLSDYKSRDALILLEGFTHGFRLNYTGPRGTRFSKNLVSARQFPEIVLQKVQKEIDAGRAAGPFTVSPMKNIQISPIGVVPKKTPGEFRLIHHLSYPEGSSINDFIDPKLCSVKYTEFDQAIHIIQELGKNCYLFKSDIKNAFRLLPINPQDFELLGFMVEDKIFFDKALPFGCSISPSLFENFSTFLEFCVKTKMKSGHLIHYLDDFLGGEKTYKSCKELMVLFKSIMDNLGVPLADEKTAGPTQIIIFLGLELDSIKMEVRIPLDKITEVVQKIEFVLSQKKVCLRVIQSLIGSLNFCCRAIPIGRPFCRRLINATCGVKHMYHYVRVNKEMKSDLKMWMRFFSGHNGVSVFHDRFWVSNDDEQFHTDSAGAIGFGIWFKGHWCNAKWPDVWHENGFTKDITVLELFPIVAAIFIWGNELRNKKIRFYCDNQAVVHILNTMTSKSPAVMMLMRVFTLQCLHYNCWVKASHISGAKNEISDSLSRFQFSRFRKLAPEADLYPSVIPNFLWNIFEADLNTWPVQE